MMSSSSARKRPFSSTASRAVEILSRPWLSPRKCSLRSQIHLTGRRERPLRPPPMHIRGRETTSCRNRRRRRRHHPHFFGWELHHRTANDIADDVTPLAAESQRIAITVIFGDHAARIEIIGHQPLVDDGQLNDACGFGESLLSRARVAGFRFECKVARPVRPNLRRTGLERGNSADHVRQLVPRQSPDLRRILRRSRLSATTKAMASPTCRTTSFARMRILRDFDIHVSEDAGRAATGPTREYRPTSARAGRPASLLLFRGHEFGIGREHAASAPSRRAALCRRDVGNVAPRPAQQRVIFLAGERLPEIQISLSLGPPCEFEVIN